MSKTNKKNLNEGAIMLTSLLPVSTYNNLKLIDRGKDNFEFKGLPGQFDENGTKVIDDEGNRIIKEDRRRYIKIPEMNKIADKYGLTEILYSLLKFYQDDEPDFAKIVNKALKESEKQVAHITD